MNQSHRFWFTLALALGQSVSVLQRQVDSQEFSKWIVFASIEPIGEFRKDIRSAAVSHVIASTVSKNTPPIKDFMVDFWSRKGMKVMSPEDMLKTIKRSVRKH